MKRFILEKSGEEFYTSHSGLALVGACINRFTDFKKRINDVSPRSGGISHADIARSYLGLLCLGKSDYDASGEVGAGEGGVRPIDDIFLDRNPNDAALRMKSLKNHPVPVR